MKKIIALALLLGLSTGPATAQTAVLGTYEEAAAYDAWTLRLQQRLDTVLATPLLQTSQLGFMVYDLTTDTPLYTYNHRQTMRPASTMKLLTAITALDRLGADYQLPTALYLTGRIAGGTLQGNVVCVGGMDPMFDRSDMAAFASELRRQGITAISGRIIGETSFKEATPAGEGWCWDDDNPVLTPLLCEGKDDFTAQLARELRRQGVTVADGQVPQGPPSARRLVSRRSHSLGQVLMRMMKESDNLYAEAVFYQLAASRPATARQAASAVRRMIQDVGLMPGDYRVADGSGLSLYNYVSAELEVQLLRHAFYKQAVLDALFPSLPVAGVDGTLKNRMQRSIAAGRVFAKTGTVTGISSLAGYANALNGHWLAFSIINQGQMKMADGRALQDLLCETMCGE